MEKQIIHQAFIALKKYEYGFSISESDKSDIRLTRSFLKNKINTTLKNYGINLDDNYRDWKLIVDIRYVSHNCPLYDILNQINTATNLHIEYEENLTKAQAAWVNRSISGYVKQLLEGSVIIDELDELIKQDISNCLESLNLAKRIHNANVVKIAKLKAEMPYAFEKAFGISISDYYLALEVSKCTII